MFSETSILWTELIDRRVGVLGDSQKEKLRKFLSPNSEQAAGTAAWDMNGTQAVLEYIKEKLDEDLFEQYSMPIAGSPLEISFLGKSVSMPYLWRFLTYQLSLTALNHLDPDTQLDIVEIGAGYGCVADLWIQSGRVRSYTIIDLPENLINSSYYLSESNPDWDLSLVQADLDVPKQHSINMLTPGHIRRVKYSGFSLAVNSDSLGEMPETTAKSYVEWLYAHMKVGGVFFSKNGHRRGYDNFGVPKVSEYGYERFVPKEFGPSNYCTSAFDDFSHVALLRKEAGVADYSDRQSMDTLANLFAAGLSKDLQGVCERFASKDMSASDKEFLNECKNFFDGRSIKSIPAEYSFLGDYLEALRQGSRGKNNLELVDSYLEHGQSDISLVYCQMFRHFFRELDDDSFPNTPAVRLYCTEFAEFDLDNPLLRWVKYQLRFDILKKKLSPNEPATRSLLMNLKNIFLNFREKGRISVCR